MKHCAKIIFFLLAVALVITQLSSCDDSTMTPEDEIRAFIKSAEEDAENRDPEELSNKLSPAFRDSRGNNRSQISKLMRGYFFKYRKIHLLTRIHEINLDSEDSATVTVFVAMASTEIVDSSILAGIRAEIYKFDLSLIKFDNAWQIDSGKWQRASASDLQS